LFRARTTIFLAVAGFQQTQLAVDHPAVVLFQFQ